MELGAAVALVLVSNAKVMIASNGHRDSSLFEVQWARESAIRIRRVPSISVARPAPYPTSEGARCCGGVDARFMEVAMKIARRFLMFGILPALLISAPAAQAQMASPWDGTWKGTMGRIVPSDITITIAQGKVVSYTVRGAPYDIQYSKLTPDAVSFGDKDNYFMKLKKTSDTTAMAKVHGRLGSGVASLTKG
jgi:hypothetical protein